MKKLIALTDIPNQLEVEELLDVKGGDGGAISCWFGVSAVTCSGQSAGISCTSEAVKPICPSGGVCPSGAGKVDPPGGGEVGTCEVKDSK